MRRRAGAVLLVAVLATACGNGSSGSSTSGHGANEVLSVIQAAAKSTAQQQSMRVRGTMTMDLGAISGGAAAGSTTVTFSSVMQTKPLLARMTMSGMEVAGQSLGDVSALITPDAFFMKIPMLSAQLGKPWMEMKFSDMKAASGFDFKQVISQSQQMQPAQYIEQLAASGDVKAVGTESINGTETTHYAGTVSVEDQLSHFSGAVRSQMQGVIDKTGWTGAKIDVWLDGKGLVRRMRSASVGGEGDMSMAMDVLAYGVRVDVTPPPADQVADLAQLANSGTG
jgi:hypothetical protein